MTDAPAREPVRSTEREPVRSTEREPVRYSVASWVVHWLAKMFIRSAATVVCRLKVTGRENEPRSGPAIYASNHIAALDPPVVGCSVKRLLTYLAKKELFDIPVLGWIIRFVHSTPVDRGGYTRGVLEIFRTLLDSGQAVILFPEGTRQRDGKLGEGKIGVGMLSVWTGAPVVPVFVTGTDALWRSLTFRRRFRVAIGEPLYPPEAETPAERKQAYQNVADEVMKRIAALKAEVEK